MPHWSKMQHIPECLWWCKKILWKHLGSRLQGGSRHRRLFPAVVLSRWKSQRSSGSTRSSKTIGGIRVSQQDRHLLLHSGFPCGIACIVFVMLKTALCFVHFPTFLLSEVFFVYHDISILQGYLLRNYHQTCSWSHPLCKRLDSCCYWICRSLNNPNCVRCSNQIRARIFRPFSSLPVFIPSKPFWQNTHLQATFSRMIVGQVSALCVE